jgi:hypothetical protein
MQPATERMAAVAKFVVAKLLYEGAALLLPAQLACFTQTD